MTLITQTLQNKQKTHYFYLNIEVKDVKENVGLEDTIRDESDIPIYRAAKKNKCDAIFTSDKDFIENKELDITVITVDEMLVG